MTRARAYDARGCPTCGGVDPRSCLRCCGTMYLAAWPDPVDSVLGYDYRKHSEIDRERTMRSNLRRARALARKGR